MVHGDYGKIHAVIRRISEFGVFLLRSLAFYISPILLWFFSNGVLYHPCQFETDISTMIDKGVCFIDYFPLYRLFWGLFSTIKHLPVNENTVFCWLSAYIGQVWFIASNS